MLRKGFVVDDGFSRQHRHLFSSASNVNKNSLPRTLDCLATCLIKSLGIHHRFTTVTIYKNVYWIERKQSFDVVKKKTTTKKVYQKAQTLKSLVSVVRHTITLVNHKLRKGLLCHQTVINWLRKKRQQFKWYRKHNKCVIQQRCLILHGHSHALIAAGFSFSQLAGKYVRSGHQCGRKLQAMTLPLASLFAIVTWNVSMSSLGSSAQHHCVWRNKLVSTVTSSAQTQVPEQ